ncbi:MAG: CotH kinase family protein [Gammaproteobacteria bacterium]
MSSYLIKKNNLTIVRSILKMFCAFVFIYSTQTTAAIQNEIDSLHLTMDEQDAEVIFRKEYNDKSSFAVTVMGVGNQELTGRVKVSGSFSRRFNKKNLIIKLDDDQQWNGQKRISLDGMATDGSMLREWLTWQFIEDIGMAGPKVEYIRVYINKIYHGLFLQTEWIDTKLFDRFGLGENGQFFHPVDSKFCGDFRYYEDKNIEPCWFKLSPQDNDFTPLLDVYAQIKKTPIENFDQYIADNFDEKSLINWLALNILTSNGDTYNKNYFIYQPEATKKWVVIPWDYDLTFGRNWDPFLAFPKSILNDNFQYYYPPQLGATNPLKEKVMRNPALNKKVITQLLHLLGIEKNGSTNSFGWFNPDQIKTRIDQAAEKLEPHHKGDPFLKEQAIDYQRETQSLWHYAQRRYAYLKETLTGEYQWDAEKAMWNYDEEDLAPRNPFPNSLRVRQTVLENGEYTIITAPAFGYALSGIHLKDNLGPAEFSTESDIDQLPLLLPTSYKPESCIQRNWYLSLLSPYHDRTMDLQLEYLQENSQRNEIGKNVNESDLKLWVLNGREWKQLDAQINTLSNVFTLENFTMQSGTILRFAACSVEQEN